MTEERLRVPRPADSIHFASDDFHDVPPGTTARVASDTDLGIEARSKGEFVATILRREIFAGKYGPDEKIPQEKVAQQLGVSRIPVREALVILEGEGRVRMELHRGAFVLPMDEESIRDNAELFGTVWAFVGRRAAERVAPALLGKFALLATRMRNTSEPGEIYQISEDYLTTIIEAGTAHRLAPTLHRMRALAVDNLFDVVPGTAELTKEGILDMIDAIRDGDPDRVAARQMELQKQAADLVVDAFRGRGTQSSARSQDE